MLQKTVAAPLRITARFGDVRRAESARAAVAGVLREAKNEVEDLFERQGGVADIIDVSNIYARYGFQNESGWQQDRPIIAHKEFLVWELPEGMCVDDAQNLLKALGAEAIELRSDDDSDLLRRVPHPAAFLLTEQELEILESDEDDALWSNEPEKKILH